MFCFKSLALISKVLFEITLLREWKKTFSCSNTSKNAVRLYCYKEQFLSFCRVCPFGLPRCSDRRFFSGKWCKDKCLFSNHQIFLKEFFRIFSEPFFVSFRTVCCIRSGCKGKSFFWISKGFRNFFQNFSEPVFVAFERCFSLEAGAKIRAFNRYFQIFRRLFFNIFGAIFTPCYASAS